MDDFGLLIGRFQTALPTLANQQLSELQLDSAGRLIISGRYLEDSAHTSGDAGLFVMAVANHTEGALHSADGDYAALQVDNAGRLRVIADVDINGLPSEKAEDSAHSSGDTGMYMLAVRQDVLASSTSVDGDYASIKVNSKGEVYVKSTDTDALLTTIDAVLDSIKVDTGNMDVSLNNIEADTAAMVIDLAAIEVEQLAQGVTFDAILVDTGVIAGDTTSIDSTLTALSKAEDAAHSSGDQGIMSLAVRRDADTSLVSADGDYAPLQVDSIGRLKIVGTVTSGAIGSEEYTVTDALAAAGDGLEVITAAATPWVTVATFTHIAGTAYVFGYQWACDQNAQVRVITDDTVNIVVYKTDINSSAMPGTSEHFVNEGRIEIAGAASLDIKLQVKKRSATGGNANGTGSMHIRK